MAIKSKASTNPSPKQQSSGVNYVNRYVFSTSDLPATLTIPLSVNAGMIRCDGPNNARISFPADKAGDYFTIKNQEWSPLIRLKGGTIMIVNSQNGPVTLECLFWGD